MWYVYVLQSLLDHSWYIGATNDLTARFKKHQNGQSAYTSKKRPWKLIYYEVSYDRQDAFKREVYLKSGYGRRYLKKRLKNQLDDVGR